MPPTFLYFVAFMVWVPLACLVWLSAAVMLLAPRTRPRALSLALAMAGTFPGVALFQLVTAPFVLAILLAVRVFWKSIEPGISTTTESPLVIGVSITGGLMAFALMLGMSIAGFCEGWRVGWVWGSGRNFCEAVRSGLPARLLQCVLPTKSRLHPSL